MLPDMESIFAKLADEGEKERLVGKASADVKLIQNPQKFTKTLTNPPLLVITWDFEEGVTRPSLAVPMFFIRSLSTDLHERSCWPKGKVDNTKGWRL
mmetsp:Transcript_9927/g.13384  ORF Transcript_9927/g.13384 Transcript_9927/m.13384 type:complete len:97 (+) Transcript_9927:260-550(+)